MLSVRMRASQVSRGCRGKSAQEVNEVHISGCEGLFGEEDLSEVVSSYVIRALNHSRGKPDRINVTIEKIRRKPRPVCSLPVVTMQSDSPRGAERRIRRLLEAAAVSITAIDKAWELLKSGRVIRGASLLSSKSGTRLEPDQRRGVRASRFGIDPMAEETLVMQLKGQGIHTTAVKEALALASKVASCKEVIAELCISDDPGYTTGYVATKKHGYVRVPHVKREGDDKGGRIFFLGEHAKPESAVKFLEEEPVLINRTCPVRGVYSLDEIIGLRHL